MSMLDTANDLQEDEGVGSEGQSKMRALDMLLGDFDKEDFFTNYWDVKSLHLPHGDGRFSDLINFEEFIEQGDRCAMGKFMYRDEDGKNRERVGTAEDFAKGRDTKGTLCANYCERVGARKDFLDSLHEDIQSLSDFYFNCYYSPTGHGYCWHIDPHPVWLLQIEGSKAWGFTKETVCPSPEHSFMLHPGREHVHLAWGVFEKPKEEDTVNVILHPGDVLYLPAGVWHTANAHEGSSLALTLAHMRVTPVDIFSYMVQRKIGSLSGLAHRLSVPPRNADLSKGGTNSRKQFEAAAESLKGLFDELLTADNFEREYSMHVERKKNFPHLYEAQLIPPENLRKQVSEEENEAIQERVKRSRNDNN